ncbi:MAG: hypothetical protein Q4D81_00500 [Eubacteriales bacterium]|nr:hypothetical protein [Eubacteriales bacterium]
MGKIRFELNKEGVRELLQSREMQDELAAQAQKKAAAAGDGYSSDVHIGTKRAYANIYPSTKEAAHDNYENNTLEKVIRS